jgi:hypothetical protein
MQHTDGSECGTLNQTINPFEFKKVLSQIKIENKRKELETKKSNEYLVYGL